jgi:hypothetical protein
LQTSPLNVGHALHSVQIGVITPCCGLEVKLRNKEPTVVEKMRQYILLVSVTKISVLKLKSWDSPHDLRSLQSISHIYNVGRGGDIAWGIFW